MRTLLAVFLLLPLLSFSQKDGVCILQGHREGLGNKKITFGYATSDTIKPFHRRIVRAHNDNFTYTVKLSEPTYYRVYYYKKKTKKTRQVFRSIEVFLDKGNMEIIGQLDSLDKAKVKGSAIEDEWCNATHTIQALYDSLYRLAAARMPKDTTRKTRPQLLPEEYKYMDTYIRRYIVEHPNSYVSAQLLLNDFGYNIKPAEDAPLLASFDEPIKASVPAIMFKRKLDVARRIDVGMQEKDISLDDINGKEVSLSSYRGKITLLDFWASWCGPCRMENPAVVKAYKAYHDKGFDIYAVSLDASKAAWKAAVAKDSLAWTQVSDLKGWKSPAAVTYGIQAIPSNVLIDRNGIIIAKNLRGEELEKKLGELLK